MSLLPERASYFEEIAACFLAFRGDGLALSARDADLVFEWHARGVPCEVVCRGIRAAAEGALPGSRAMARPRSLRAIRRAIESEIERHLKVSVGAARPCLPEATAVRRSHTPNDVWPADAMPTTGAGMSREEADYLGARFDRARASLDAASREGRLPASRIAFLAALLECANATNADDADDSGPAARLTRFDEALAIFSLRARPFPERLEILRRARQRAGTRPRLTSPWAFRQSLRHHLFACLRASGLVDGPAIGRANER